MRQRHFLRWSSSSTHYPFWLKLRQRLELTWFSFSLPPLECMGGMFKSLASLRVGFGKVSRPRWGLAWRFARQGFKLPAKPESVSIVKGPKEAYEGMVDKGAELANRTTPQSRPLSSSRSSR